MPMIGFELRISGIGSDRSAQLSHCHTTAHLINDLVLFKQFEIEIFQIDVSCIQTRIVIVEVSEWSFYRCLGFFQNGFCRIEDNFASFIAIVRFNYGLS